MSGNIRRQLGPVRKRLTDRIKEAYDASKDDDNLPILVDLRNKLYANIASHEKFFNKLESLENISEDEQPRVDEVWESCTELDLDANEALEMLNRRISELKELISKQEPTRISTREDDRLNHEIEKLKVETEYRRKKLEKLDEQTNTDNLQQNIKLPNLELPTFAGKITEWPTFWDSFRSAIHENGRVSKIDKFKYLVSLLRGEAKNTIKGFNLTETHYIQAVEQLKERYDDKDQIIHNHYMMLTNTPKCKDITHDLRLTFNFLEAQIRSLEALGEDVNNNHIISLMKSKFPGEFIRRLEETHEGTWTRALIRKAITKLIVAREKSENDVDKSITENTTENYTGETLFGNEQSGNKIKCYFCGGNHWSDVCQQVKTLEERKQKIRGRCFICLNDKHLYRECLNQKPCFYCKRKHNHHSSLCPTKFGTGRLTDETNTFEEEGLLGAEKHTIEKSFATEKYQVMMKTAKVELWNVDTGTYRIVTAVLDTGAKKSYVTKEIARSLNLNHGPTNMVKLNTFGTTNTRNIQTNRTKFAVKLKDSSKLMLNASICNEITGSIVKHELDISKYEHIWKDLDMADEIPNRSKLVKIDLLIGSDYYEDIVKAEKIKIDEGLYLVNSTIGWLFSGRVTHTNDHDDHNELSMFVSSNEADEYVNITKNFWELETIGIRSPNNEKDDENEFMMNFNNNIQNIDGRYYVSWPWKHSKFELHDNYYLAKGRLKSLINKLSKNPLMIEKYDDTINRQIDIGVVEKINNKINSDRNETVFAHYLPHHMVLKNNDESKLRIVYEGCAKQVASQKSLNDCLYRGPNLVKNLCGILMRFRMNSIPIIADIEKAYLQLGLNNEDKDVTRFLWLRDVNKPFSDQNIQELRFCRVIWGIVSSAYLLAATINYHIQKEKSNVSNDVERNLYVDNLITGVNNENDAISFYKEVKLLFSKASMNMCKWITNNENVMNNINEKDRSEEKITKVLGMMWNVKGDYLNLRCSNSYEIPDIITKRHMLKVLASTYDPLGLLSPVLIKPKLMIQELWKRDLGWDTEIPLDIYKEWIILEAELNKIKKVNIKRYINIDTNDELNRTYELIVFVDASKVAYAAVAFLKICNGNINCVNLIFSKTRLAPIKAKLTIPRLELLAVVIGCRVSRFIINELDINLSKRTTIFTDAICVIEWCKSTKPLKKFVMDRIDEIKSFNFDLRYVESSSNPADVASRGCTVEKLNAMKLWWEGPEWLSTEKELPMNNYVFDEETRLISEAEVKKGNHLFEIGLVIVDESKKLGPFDIDENKFSKLSTLIRITSWCHRFINNLKGKNIVGVLHPNELQKTENMWTKHIQQKYFHEEFKAIQNGKRNTIITRLGLYLNENGLLCCGGRFLQLDNHPKLLPKSSTFTRLVITSIHENLNHAGISQVLAHLRKEYWVIQGRSAVRKVIRYCLTCIRWEGGPFKNPPFSVYPKYVTKGNEPAFSNVGIDYLGPLKVKENDEMLKNWVCLITCLNVRAIHLELIDNLTTESFLLCIRRFIARRGKPRIIISDNASQFKLGNLVLNKIWNDIVDEPEVQTYISNNGILWKNTVEYAPWKGGFYERLIGMTKRSLRKSLGIRKLGKEEFWTLLIETEAVINSRPILYVEDDINSNDALTPAHFLTLNQKTGIPDWNDDMDFRPDSSQEILIRWKNGHQTLNKFWQIWSTEYLDALRERKMVEMKARKGEVDRTPKCGEIVLVKQDNLKRGKWKLAKIVRLIKGEIDDVERAATLLTKDGKYINRPFSVMYSLELTDDKYLPDEPLKENNEISEIENTLNNNQSNDRPKRGAAIKASANVSKWIKDMQ